MDDTKVVRYVVSPHTGCIVAESMYPDAKGHRFVTHAEYRAIEEKLAAYRNLTVEVSVLQDQFSRYADADCRDCDGRGVYYGNVCVCHCVTEKLADATRTPKEQKK